MTTPAPHKLSNIQALRGLAALLVVFTHLPSMEIKHGGDSILPAFIRFGISGVDLFFVISGFIMVYVTWESRRNAKNSLKFLFARLSRIYPIYWFIAALVLAAWKIQPDLMSFDPRLTSLWKSFLLWPDITFPMLKVAWTLIHELYFYLVFAVILLLPRRFLLPALIVWMLFVLAGNLDGWSGKSPEAAIVFHPLTAEFFLGAMAGVIFKRFRAAIARPTLIVGILMWLAGLYYLATTLGPAEYPTDWERVLYFGMPGVFIVYGVAAIEQRGKYQFPRWCSVFGDWSYSLYLSHILTLSVLGYAWRPVARASKWDNVLMLPVLVLGSVAVSALLWYVFEQPVLRRFKRLRERLFPRAQPKPPQE